MATTKASDLILPKLDELKKQFESFNLQMITQFTQVHEELEALKEKVAAAPKKPSTRGGTTKTTQQLSPTGKKPYNNKMLWWKDMFAAHYEQYVKELFTSELDSDEFIAEAEADVQNSKNKDKVGEARYKAMADYIWRTKIKEDGHEKFRNAVFKKFDSQKSNGDNEEATVEDNNDVGKGSKADVAEPESDAANDSVADADGDGDGDGDNDDEDHVPVAKATTKKVTPAKAPPKQAAKGPAKGVTKGASKGTTKTPAKAKK